MEYPIKIKLAVLTSVSFPFGMAATNRIISYSKGLVAGGNLVSVFTVDFPRIDGKLYQGVHFKCFGKERFFKINKLLASIFSLISLMIYLFKNARSFNAVLIVSNSLSLILFAKTICKVKNLPILIEKSEFPFVLNNSSLIGKAYARLYVNYVYRLFDGMIIMTSPLIEYFKAKVNEETELFHMPMTVESDRFDGDFKNPTGIKEYLAYCGYMGGNKDGLENLIIAFKEVENVFANLKLLLIGTAPEKELNRLKKLVSNLNLKNVIFYGKVNRDQIPALLFNAKALLLARPTSLQSSGGFPTKLGEYLSTGKPVIVTDVGEIGNYIVDGENGFIVEPDNNSLFAKKIIWVINNYNQAIKVGIGGKKLVSDIFSSKVQSKRLEVYLKRILKKGIN